MYFIHASVKCGVRRKFPDFFGCESPAKADKYRFYFYYTSEYAGVLFTLLLFYYHCFIQYYCAIRHVSKADPDCLEWALATNLSSWQSIYPSQLIPASRQTDITFDLCRKWCTPYSTPDEQWRLRHTPSKMKLRLDEWIGSYSGLSRWRCGPPGESPRRGSPYSLGW